MKKDILYDSFSVKTVQNNMFLTFMKNNLTFMINILRNRNEKQVPMFFLMKINFGSTIDKKICKYVPCMFQELPKTA